jgi:hypothetical protein
MRVLLGPHALEEPDPGRPHTAARRIGRLPRMVRRAPNIGLRLTADDVAAGIKRRDSATASMPESPIPPPSPRPAAPRSPSACHGSRQQHEPPDHVQAARAAQARTARRRARRLADHRRSAAGGPQVRFRDGGAAWCRPSAVAACARLADSSRKASLLPKALPIVLLRLRVLP